jgi:hypothetical protein
MKGLRTKVYIHRKIPYAFNWNEYNHNQKFAQLFGNHNEIEKLNRYFKKVHHGDIPNDLFNSINSPRVSQFKIRGIKHAFLSSFSKKLIRKGMVQYLDSKSKLPCYVQKVYTTYRKNGIKRVPGHDPVLKNILIKDINSVAIEVPIWKRFEETFITGHIDLIQIVNDTVKIADYKPEGNFLVSLPQVAAYGLLIKSILNLNKIKCVSFNKREAWEYDPHILKTEVRAFLTLHRIDESPWKRFIEEL